MKFDRDWSTWDVYVVDDQEYIVKASFDRSPFPAYKEDFGVINRWPNTPIFNLKVWGVRGYR